MDFFILADDCDMKYPIIWFITNIHIYGFLD